MDRSWEAAVWERRVGVKAARAILRANRATDWSALFYMGFLVNAALHFARVGQWQLVALVPLLIGGLALIVGAALRRRAVRLIRHSLGSSQRTIAWPPGRFRRSTNLPSSPGCDTCEVTPKSQSQFPSLHRRLLGHCWLGPSRFSATLV